MPARYFLGAVGDFTPANGTEITARIRFPNEEGFEETCDASNAGICTVELEDPGGDFSVQVWQPFWVTEQDCTTDTRVYTGFVMEVDYSRSVQQALIAGSTARLITLTLIDLNGATKLRVIRGASGKRPVEPTTTRVDWLLSDVLDGIVFDNGLLDVPTVNRDEADFRGNYANDVLSAMAQDGALDTYVIWDGTASPGEQFTLVIEPIDGAQRSSTLSLSNVLADTTATPSTIFPPDPTAILKRDGTEVYSGILLRYSDGEIYRTRAATDSTYFGDYGRDWVEDEQRIGRTATAQDVATTLLEKHSIPVDTITCKVILPTSKVNLIRAGMALPVKFSHFPGYSSYVNTKVKKRSVRELGHDTTSRYELTLELSVGISVSGGGGPGAGETPFQPCSTDVAIVQRHTQAMLTWEAGVDGHDAFVFDQAPGVGNLCVVIIGEFENQAPLSVPAGWTELATAVHYPTDQKRMMAYSFTSDGSQEIGTTQGLSWVSGNTLRYVMWELSGVTVDSIVSKNNQTGGTGMQISGTIPDGGIALYGTGCQSSFSQSDWVMAAPFTNVYVTAKGTEPRMSWGEYLGSGAVTAGVTLSPAKWGGFLVLLAPGGTDPNDDCAPRPGQDVLFENVATGNGSTSSFTTDYAFAIGSLRVYVDRLDQTAAVVAQDGAAKTFSLGFAPAAGELVEVSYQGR